MPLDTFYWDYIVPEWQTPESVKAHMKDMKAHYVNVASLHPWSIPRLAADENGKLITDYSIFDRTIDAYEAGLAPATYRFEMLSTIYFEPSKNIKPNFPGAKNRPKFLTPQWKALFREWLGKWVAHMKARGIGYDDFIMHPYDERLDANVIAVIKLIKEVDQRILVLVNPYGYTVEQVKAIAPYVDACAPYLYNFTGAGGVNGYIGQRVSLKPNTAYELSFYFKNGSANLYYEVVFNGSTARRANLLDAADWRQETFSFTTGPDTNQVQISFYPAVGNGTLLIDDVVLRSESGPDLIVNGDMEAGNPPGVGSRAQRMSKTRFRLPSSPIRPIRIQATGAQRSQIIHCRPAP